MHPIPRFPLDRLLVNTARQSAHRPTFVLPGQPNLRLRSGEWSQGQDALLCDAQVRHAALLGMSPPAEQGPCDTRRLRQTLAAILARRNLPWLPALRLLSDEDEAGEPVLCVLGIRFADADELAWQFRQDSFLWLEQGRPAIEVMTA